MCTLGNDPVNFKEVEKWLEFLAAGCEGSDIPCDESCPYHYYCVAIRLLREIEGRIDRLEEHIAKDNKLLEYFKSLLKTDKVKTDKEKQIELQKELDDALHQLTRRDLLLREMGITIPEETEERK